ncbi:MAG TPA: ABC transporter ATP-binding protein [Acidimicrobiales bacterium]|nr:ABC transporter ATP-binding protein [Acidimicrobiales bacterium]
MTVPTADRASPAASAGGPPIVELTGVGKRYVKYDDAPMLVTAALRLRTRTRRSTLWAVRNVDLSLRRGECFGVIGRNGSGKTTMLGMLAGVTAPTEGRVTVRGRVAPLISVGVGFHPELTGRENVYVNGTVLGLTRRQIDARFDEIVDFAEISRFIDTPVKFYSSGMFVRLGFAVAVQAEPDVLLIDEILAVGDLGFQVKCFERMMAIRDSGATIVVVSHNLNAVRQMCDRTAVLHNGVLRFVGETAEAISVFHDILALQDEPDFAATQSGPGAALPHSPGVARVESAELIGADGQVTRHVRSGERVKLRVTVGVLADVEHPIVGLGVLSEEGTGVYSDASHDLRMPPLRAGTTVTYEIGMVVALLTGTYTAAVSLTDAGRTVLATTAPLAFFVSGRPTAAGVAELEATFGVEQP